MGVGGGRFGWDASVGRAAMAFVAACLMLSMPTASAEEALVPIPTARMVYEPTNLASPLQFAQYPCAAGQVEFDGRSFDFHAAQQTTSCAVAGWHLTAPSGTERVQVSFSVASRPTPGSSASTDVTIVPVLMHPDGGFDPVGDPITGSELYGGPLNRSLEFEYARSDRVGLGWQIQVPSTVTPPIEGSDVPESARPGVNTLSDLVRVTLVDVLFPGNDVPVAMSPADQMRGPARDVLWTRTLDLRIGSVCCRFDGDLTAFPSFVLLTTPVGWEPAALSGEGSVLQAAETDPLSALLVSEWWLGAPRGEPLSAGQYEVTFVSGSAPPALAGVVVVGIAGAVMVAAAPVGGALIVGRWRSRTRALGRFHRSTDMSLIVLLALAFVAYLGTLWATVSTSGLWLASGWPLTTRAVYGLVGGLLSLVFLGVALTSLRSAELTRSEASAAAAKAAESQMTKRAEDLETLAYGVTHDLKTPLIALSWLADDLEQDLRNVGPDARATLERIRTSVGGMERLVFELGAVSQVDSGALEQEPIDVDAFVAEVVEGFTEQVQRQGVTLSTEVPPGTRVVADADRLRLALRNLVGNALKYGRDAGGHVHVGVDPQDDGGVRFFVDDDGPGVAPEQRERIFDLLVRNVEDARAIEGTGLGLAMVRRVAERHGGRAYCTEAPLGGARFVLEIPRRVDG